MGYQGFQAREHPIFPPFHFHKWRAVDDRVRGGSSVSHIAPVKIDVYGQVMNVLEHEEFRDEIIWKRHDKDDRSLAARFWGNLDIKTLGGAGFASQSFLYGPYPLHLPRIKYEGIVISALPDPLQLSQADAHLFKEPMEFTFVIKTTPTNHIPKHPKVPPAPRAAKLTYEVHFILAQENNQGKTPGEQKFYFPWGDFKAVYRGKEVKGDGPKWVPLDTSSIYEVSLMCRSGFGKQEGDFGVIVTGISAWEKEEKDQEETGCWQGVRKWFRYVIGHDVGVKLEESDDEKQYAA
ncbi:hypothetical protein C356_01620 [Cryptococcus neoformans c45]|nr:hypothetical protein C356_01620 [Cryptococcus neoformans var. grubii c45]